YTASIVRHPLSLHDALPISLISLAVMSFCLSYLAPQFSQKDERARVIREKGMFFSGLAFLIYSVILTTALQFNLISLSAIEAIKDRKSTRLNSSHVKISYAV